MNTQYSQFVAVMTGCYGLSEQYADAAWLCDTGRDPRANGGTLAHNYCRSFNITKQNKA